jgi:hypothetical protein
VLFAVWKWVPAVAVGAALIGFFMLAALPVILEIAERRAGSAGTSATALIWLCGNAGGIVIAILVQLVVHQPAVAFLLMAAIALLVLRFVWQGSLSEAVVEAQFPLATSTRPESASTS